MNTAEQNRVRSWPNRMAVGIRLRRRIDQDGRVEPERDIVKLYDGSDPLLTEAIVREHYFCLGEVTFVVPADQYYKNAN